MKTPKGQDLRVGKQPREGSRDRGYRGTEAGDRPTGGSPHLAADCARPVGREGGRWGIWFYLRSRILLSSRKQMPPLLRVSKALLGPITLRINYLGP